jgi:type II secretory pathway pseudopilin PulG
MKRSAFTLVELIVAIGLSVILMLGIAKVFTTTQAVVSSNQAISTATRDARAVQSVLAKDFNDFAQDGPFMILHNEARPAFRNAQDAAGDRDANPMTRDLDGDNLENDVTLPAEYNERNHRLDTLSFFMRSLRPRVTGGTVAQNGASPFIASMTSQEEWAWFGHLRLSANNGSLTNLQDPGAGTIGVNQNNLYSSQWVFGRELILLRTVDKDGEIKDNAGTANLFISAAPSALAPLAIDSRANSGTYLMQNSRYDLANTSIADYRTKLTTFLNNPANANVPWWDQLFSGSSIAAGTLSTTRFESVPFVTKPITPASLSQLAPIFLNNASSVTIEYAGDYLEQSLDQNSATFGTVTGVYKPVSLAPNVRAATDGRIDFIALPVPAGSPPGTRPQTRIRWYGQPRNSNGTTLNGKLTIPGWQAGRTANDLTEVVPLRDVWRTYAPEAFNQTGAPFEKNTQTTMPPKADYLAAGGGMVAGNDYTCAWTGADPRPKMIRLIVTIDDPQGRTPSGTTVEMVFNLGQ